MTSKVNNDLFIGNFVIYFLFIFVPYYVSHLNLNLKEHENEQEIEQPKSRLKSKLSFHNVNESTPTTQNKDNFKYVSFVKTMSTLSRKDSQNDNNNNVNNRLELEWNTCSLNDNIGCECISLPPPITTESINDIKDIKSSNDIFHLTKMVVKEDEDLNLISNSTVSMRINDTNGNDKVEPLWRLNTFQDDLHNVNENLKQKQNKPNLADILLDNYDPKFASKLGINLFVPMQVLNNLESNGPESNLQFIPFENIEQNYPKYYNINERIFIVLR
jgi:hypothetical protein